MIPAVKEIERREGDKIVREIAWQMCTSVKRVEGIYMWVNNDGPKHRFHEVKTFNFKMIS